MADSDIPAEAVEAAAQALSVRMTGFYDFNGVEVRGTYQEHAAAILAVADPHIRADERARVLAEVDAALRDRDGFWNWANAKPSPRDFTQNRETCADYLRDVLGAGGEREEGT